jgi:sarcosine oxidase, subunit beta
MTQSADLVVVGAGTVGGWASVLAARDGVGRVLVLDAGVAGQGASSRAAGIVRTQGGTIAVDLARFSVAFYRELNESPAIDSDFRTLGYLILALTEDDVHAAQLRLAMQRERGVDARWVSPEQAAELLPLLDPDRILGATYCADDGAITPPRNVAAYLVAMRDAGVTLHERTPVIGLQLRGGRVTGVVTEGGTIATERVILAGGVGQSALAALTHGPAPPVGGSRHHVFVTSPAPELDGGALPMGFDLAAGLYWRQEEGGLLFGVSDPDEEQGEAHAIDERTQRAARERLGELLPMTRALALRKAWAATIDYTPDHLPILGPALGREREPIAGATLASAAGHGMMWGPGVARVAVDLALRGATAVTDVSFLGADRFDADGRSRLAADPIALPFPQAVLR